MDIVVRINNAVRSLHIQRVFALLCLGLLNTFILCGCEDDFAEKDTGGVREDTIPASEVIDTSSYRERNDVQFFTGVDSLRGRLLFIDATSMTSIQCLTDMNDTLSTLFSLPALNSGFTGTASYVYVLPDQNYLVYEKRKDDCHRLWKLWVDEKRLEPVFTYRNKYQYLHFNWGLEYNPDKHIIYLSEYGVSGGNPLDPEDSTGTTHLGNKGGATKIWQSGDDGETWTEFTDFKQQNIFYDYFHIHALHYDRYQHRLYVTTGDGWVKDNLSNKKLWWTDDDGQTWQSRDWRYYWGTSNDAYSHGQLVSLYADKDFILAAGDDYNNCIYRIEKKDTLQLEKVYLYNDTVKGLITQYGQRFKKLSNGMIVTMLVQGDGNGFPRRDRLVGTYDGKTWCELFSSSTMQTASDGVYQMGVCEEWKGHLYFLFRGKEDNLYKSRFIEMPISK